MHPAVANVLQYFRFEHLPDHLQEVSRPFALTAISVARRNPNNPETEVALRKLLEAKDAAVRAALPFMTVDQVVAWAEAVAVAWAGLLVPTDEDSPTVRALFAAFAERAEAEALVADLAKYGVKAVVTTSCPEGEAWGVFADVQIPTLG